MVAAHDNQTTYMMKAPVTAALRVTTTAAARSLAVQGIAPLLIIADHKVIMSKESAFHANNS